MTAHFGAALLVEVQEQGHADIARLVCVELDDQAKVFTWHGFAETTDDKDDPTGIFYSDYDGQLVDEDAFEAERSA
jgi:hypothetical protein